MAIASRTVWPIARTTSNLTLAAMLAILVCFAGQGQAMGQDIFADNFDDPDGTPVNGKAPDLGSGNWNVTVGAGGFNVNAGAANTTGGARQGFATFLDTLSPGETLTLNFATSAPGGGNFFSAGFANIALYDNGGSERIAIGDSGGATTWSIEHGGVGLLFAAPLASPGSQTEEASGSATYEYNTGAYDFTVTPNGFPAFNDSGALASGDGYRINNLRIANNNGGDIAVSDLSVSVASTTTDGPVFADDFSDANGTPVDGKGSDVGRGWEQTSGGGISVQNGQITTTGGARVIFGEFNDTLSEGETLNFSFSTEDTANGNFFSSGFAGVSLFDDEGVERIFIGDPSNATTWGLRQSGLNFDSIISDEMATAEFIYDFDSGDYSFLLDGALLDQGMISAGLELDSFRIANNDGGDITLSNVSADFSVAAVPEPASVTIWSILGMGLAGFGFYRARRKK